MVLLTLRVADSTSYGGANFLVSTTSPAAVTSDDPNFILSDGSDATFYRFNVLGGGTSDVSQGATFGPLDSNNLIPTNSTIRTVNLDFRLENISVLCPFPTSGVEVWGQLAGSEQQLAIYDIPRTFTQYVTPSLGKPFNSGTLVSWSDEGVLGPFVLDNCKFGIRARTVCGSDPNPLGLTVLTAWPAAVLLVDVKPPTPTVTTAPVGSVGVAVADLRGSFNPNQDIFFAGAGVNYQFQFGQDPNAMVAVGNSQGPIYGNLSTTVSFTQRGLTGLTSYYYRLTVTVDGDTYLGNTVTFKTTSTDPSFGAY